MLNEHSSASPSTTLLRLSLAYVYFHFGFLKFFPDLSPGELIAGQTVMGTTLFWLDAHTSLMLLAVMECTIALGFLFNVALRWTCVVFFLHMLGTFLPLVLLPEFTYKIAPFAPTLEGQYILKNVVLVAAAWTVFRPLGWRRKGVDASASEKHEPKKSIFSVPRPKMLLARLRGATLPCKEIS